MKQTTTALVATIAALSFSAGSVAVAQDTLRPGVEKREGSFVDGDAARTQRGAHPVQDPAETVGRETTAMPGVPAPEVADRDGAFVDGDAAHSTRAPEPTEDIPAATGSVQEPSTPAAIDKRNGAFVDGDAAHTTRAPTPIK